MGSAIQDTINEISIQIIYSIVIVVYKTARRWIERRHPLVKLVYLATIAIFFVASTITAFNTIPNYFIYSFFITFGLLLYVLVGELSVLWKLGILGADRAIAKGIDYRKALQMCKDSMDFLGIGASKLVGVREDFRSAVSRCHRDHRPIRLLLCPPDHAELIQIASRAGRPATEYQATVKKSLGELRDLKIGKKMNIEVRFYTKLPLFRLMFINDNICLASHYILGEGDGSQLPQLHIISKPLGNRDIESMYYPLNRYFMNMWDEATPWDFQKYL